MTRYFTADLHLGHRNIISYCGRPFRDVDDMNAGLVDRWNDTVDPGDEVIVLGDVAMGRLRDSLALVARLHGRKVLVAGNHDRCWAGHRRGVKAATARYRAAGFDEIWQGVVSLDLDGTPVRACHFPYHGDSHDHDRYVGHRPVDTGHWLLHGHVHHTWQTHERMVNVGVDVWDYAPVAEDVVASLVRDGSARAPATGSAVPGA
jgi:calcineurin-like phosphoesterase family protein